MWEVETNSYARQILSLCDRFAPGTSKLVENMMVRPPRAIESHFGITAGHIHHVGNLFGFSDCAPYRTGPVGLYACSAGCHPAESVIGPAGHHGAQVILTET